MNDVSVRDWQSRTSQWLQGKAWERSTPLGPWLVTLDESPGPAREISCEIDGITKQKADTSDLVSARRRLVSYVSTFTTLRARGCHRHRYSRGCRMGTGTVLAGRNDHGHSDRTAGRAAQRLPSGVISPLGLTRPLKIDIRL